MPKRCARCDDTGWVCEVHRERPWREAHSERACPCPAQGMPCELCNPDDPPDIQARTRRDNWPFRDLVRLRQLSWPTLSAAASSLSPFEPDAGAHEGGGCKRYEKIGGRLCRDPGQRMRLRAIGRGTAICSSCSGPRIACAAVGCEQAVSKLYASHRTGGGNCCTPQELERVEPPVRWPQAAQARPRPSSRSSPRRKCQGIELPRPGIARTLISPTASAPVDHSRTVRISGEDTHCLAAAAAELKVSEPLRADWSRSARINGPPSRTPYWRRRPDSRVVSTVWNR